MDGIRRISSIIGYSGNNKDTFFLVMYTALLCIATVLLKFF